jgi:diguanylate cyclase (GGDEF)-like protein
MGKIRAWLIPLSVLGLTAWAGLSIALLEVQADKSRRDQLKIASVNLALADLPNAAFSADPHAGGSPTLALRSMRLDEQTISRGVAELAGESSAPGSLASVTSDLTSLYRVVRQIYEMGAYHGGYGQAVNPLQARQAELNARLAAMLQRASKTYDRRASHARARAIVGSALTIAVLLVSFAFFYWRARRARQLAERLAAHNRELLAASRDDALTDVLTGLRNRRALNQDLDELVAKATKEDELMLALFDLDGFKQYNDTFGHPAGDELLARLGKRLSEAAEGVGTAYRMGGDEFCVVAHAGTERGCALVEAARDALADAGDGWDIRSSYGVVWVPSEATSSRDALTAADQRMYESKSARANRA